MTLLRLLRVLLVAASFSFAAFNSSYSASGRAQDPPATSEVTKQLAVKDAQDAAATIGARAAYANDTANRLLQGSVTEPDKVKLRADFGDKIADQANQNPTAAAQALKSLASVGNKTSVRLNQATTAAADKSPEAVGRDIDNAIKKPDAILKLFNVAESPSANVLYAPNSQAHTAVFGRIMNDLNDPYTTAFSTVALLLFKNRDGAYFLPSCSATLISPLNLVTAAHCFCPRSDGTETSGEICKPSHYENDGANWKVFLQGSGLYSVDHIIVSDKYRANDFGYRHDIAVVTLKEPVAYLPTALLATQRPTAGNPTIVGFGESYAPQLAMANGTHVPDRPVGAGLKSAAPVALESTCAGVDDQTQALCWNSGSGGGLSSYICGGDSGGGMFAPASGAQFSGSSPDVLLGINSAANALRCQDATLAEDTDVTSSDQKGFLKDFTTSISACKEMIYWVRLAKNPLEPAYDDPANGIHQPHFRINTDQIKSLRITLNAPLDEWVEWKVIYKSNVICDDKTNILDSSGAASSLYADNPVDKSCTIEAPHNGDTVDIRIQGPVSGTIQLLAVGYLNPVPGSPG